MLPSWSRYPKSLIPPSVVLLAGRPQYRLEVLSTIILKIFIIIREITGCLSVFHLLFVQNVIVLLD